MRKYEAPWRRNCIATEPEALGRELCGAGVVPRFRHAASCGSPHRSYQRPRIPLHWLHGYPSNVQASPCPALLLRCLRAAFASGARAWAPMMIINAMTIRNFFTQFSCFSCAAAHICSVAEERHVDTIINSADLFRIACLRTCNFVIKKACIFVTSLCAGWGAFPT